MHAADGQEELAAGPEDIARDAAADLRLKEREHRRLAVRFLCARGRETLPLLYMLRLALDAQVRAMRQLLLMSDPEFDLQRLRGTQEHTRLSLLHAGGHPGGMFCQALSKMLRMLKSPGLWDHLRHTHMTCMQLMQLFLRAASTLYQNLNVRVRDWPYRLFSVLHDHDRAPALVRQAASERCRLDPFSREFLERFPDAEALCSQQAQLELEQVALSARGSIYLTERLHSTHARRARNRPHTHQVALHMLGFWRTSRAAPAWLPCVKAKMQTKDTVARKEPPSHMEDEMHF